MYTNIYIYTYSFVYIYRAEYNHYRTEKEFRKRTELAQMKTSRWSGESK